MDNCLSLANRFASEDFEIPKVWKSCVLVLQHACSFATTVCMAVTVCTVHVYVYICTCIDLLAWVVW